MQMNKLGHIFSVQKTINQRDPSGSRYGPKRDSLAKFKNVVNFFFFTESVHCFVIFESL